MAEGALMDDLFLNILEDKGRVQALAEQKRVSAEMLSLLLYLAIRPSIEKGAAGLASYLNGGSDRHSHCPVCGSAPILGELDADGQRWVHCSLCWHRWSVERMVCLFCGNRSSDSLEYLYSEEEPEYRLYLCNDCEHYMKVVDTRQLTRGFFAPLEQVVSLHLDMMASDKGYEHALGRGAAMV
jgi:FdhE protein